ncbi:hypothetical protein F4604DRAFT_1935052 [Suillus subluteus]|nr:hypothetical protein F4604DRAFT_1935052 [Suillus subluteus]
MTSHGNITTATLSAMVNGMEMAKTQAPPVWNIPDGLHVTFTVLPLYHPLGLYTTSFFNLNASTIVMLPKWDIDIFFDSVPKYHITTVFLVPSLLHQLVHHPHFKTADMKSVKAIASGAAYLPPRLADRVSARFTDIPRITEGYGMSEFIDGGHRHEAHSWHARWTRRKQVLLPAVESRVVRPDGSLAGPNEPGELLVRGGSVALGYKGNDKATQETFVDGWARTGDQIRIDEDEDTLKILEMQVSPVAIENTILAQPDRLITDVSVSGGRTPDERILRAWIVLSPAGAVLGEKEVVTRLNVWVQERLGRYKWLRGGIGIVETIPKSPTGKVLRRMLVEGYEKEVKANAKL